jgi:hypothetical protein
MRLAGIITASCMLASSGAVAQPTRVGTCADFVAAGAGPRNEAIVMSGVWVAGFTQAKVLSCTAIERVSGAERQRLERTECALRDAGNAFLSWPAPEQSRRIEALCRRFPEHEMSMALLLLLADINRSNNAQP